MEFNVIHSLETKSSPARAAPRRSTGPRTTMAAPRQEALRLYRRILTLHRRKLEPRMRVLGDAYVRDEFKRHKDAAPKFVPLFMHEWEQYAAALAKQQDTFGRELLESEKSLLNGEQKEKLQSLKDAAKSVGEAMT